jgi:SAM-dependent methyltransferase
VGLADDSEASAGVNAECRICGNQIDNREYTAREMMFGLRHTFRYFECSRCGCLQIATIPEDMGPYYPSAYYSFEPASPPPEPRSSLKDRLRTLRDRFAMSRRGLAGKLLFKIYPRDELLPFLVPVRLRTSSRILDVGCGSGLLLLQLRALGFKHLLGVDPFIDRDIHYDSGVAVRKSTVFDVLGEWDLIMFHHSFEHIREPLETLKRCARMLAPGGCCLLRIPTVSSYAWEHYRTNWVQLDAPRHFFLYSIRALELLSAQAGLKIADVVYDSSGFQFWASEQYVRDIPLISAQSCLNRSSSPIFSESDILEFDERARVLNAGRKGDQAAFYLVKDACSRPSL